MRELFEKYLENRLAQARDSGLYRTLRAVDSFDGPEVELEGRKYISFASNDYLGLSRHPDVIAAASEAIGKYGAGAGASRLVIGDLAIHRELEKQIATFKGREAARVFATGYLANIGAINSLIKPGDAIVSDEKNHSSIIDACRLSGAKILVYRHLDMNSLREKLEEAKEFNNVLVATESVFSIDGDIAPVAETARLAKEFGAWSMIDEAHATGIIGASGRGSEELFDCTGEIDIVMGTFSKAVGSQGGFIAGSERLAEMMVNSSRTFIYSTGLAPAASASALESLRIMERAPELRERLFENVDFVNQVALKLGMRKTPSETPVIPLTIGGEAEAVKAFEMMKDRGLIVPVMRYPTVPMGEACLRISASTLHTTEHLEKLADGLAAL